MGKHSMNLIRAWSYYNEHKLPPNTEPIPYMEFVRQFEIYKKTKLLENKCQTKYHRVEFRHDNL